MLISDEENNNNGDNKGFSGRTLQVVGNSIKGAIQATKNYSIILNDRTSAVNIVIMFLKNGLPDPHTGISSVTFYISENIAKICKPLSYVLVPADLIIDAARIGKSAMKDYEKGTVQNIVVTVSSIVGGRGGGLAGAKVGAKVGSLITPGAGTILGGMIGGIGGAIGGSTAAEKIAFVVTDKLELDSKWLRCKL